MKKYEIEQKYRDIRPQIIRQKLRRLKARKVASGAEINDLYDFKNHLTRRMSILRLRRYGKKQDTLTFKGPLLKSQHKKRREAELAVDGKMMKQVLELLGYRIRMTYRKKREQYRVAQTTVTLDYVRRAGWFLEIEGSVKNISRLEKRLGLSMTQREHRTYMDIYQSVNSGALPSRRKK